MLSMDPPPNPRRNASDRSQPWRILHSSSCVSQYVCLFTNALISNCQFVSQRTALHILKSLYPEAESSSSLQTTLRHKLEKFQFSRRQAAFTDRFPEWSKIKNKAEHVLTSSGIRPVCWWERSWRDRWHFKAYAPRGHRRSRRHWRHAGHAKRNPLQMGQTKGRLQHNRVKYLS